MRASFPLYLTGFRFILILILFGVAVTSISAQSELKDGMSIVREEVGDSMRVVQEIEISRETHRSTHNEDLEYQYAQSAVEIAMDIGNSLLYASALDNLGLLHRFHQNYQEAIPLHVKALSIVKGLDEAALQNMIYANNAGVACRYAQEYDKAVKYYMHALKIAEEQNDLKNIAISCNGLGNTLLHIPNREEDAIAYFERSLKAEEERGNSLGVAMNYLSISDYYTENGAYLKARSYLNKLLKINTEREDVFGLAITYQFFGLNYLQEGSDLERSKNYYLKSLALFEELDNTHKQAELLMHLGELSRLRQQYAQAIDYYNQSLSLAQPLNNKGLLIGLYHDLSIAYEERNNSTKALEFYKLAQQYKDSVALKEQETEIAAIEKRYAIEKKESQIALLEKDKKLQQAQFASQQEAMRNQKFILVILLIGLIAIGLIAIMQYRNIKIKKKSNQLLLHSNQQIIRQRDEISSQKEEIIKQQQKNEARRIKLLESKFENKIQSLALQSLESQMNPHFLFNGMNAVRWLVVQNKNKEAMDYMNTFAQLLRLSLTNNRKEVIPLKEELKTTGLYLEIEKLRFSSEFTYEVAVSTDVDVSKIMVPPKILQPLAENAVKHGLLPSRKTAKKLWINVLEKDGAVYVEMIDNGMGIKKSYQDAPPKEDGAHLGLKLIQERLSIHNEKNRNKITFAIGTYKEEDSEQVKGTRAVVKIIPEEIIALESAKTPVSL